MEQADRIRVIVADDHAMVRTGLATFLNAYSDLDLVGEAADGQEAVRLCLERKPDIVLMDMRMPGLDGPEATRAIRENCPNTQIIAISSSAEPERVHSALQAGAMGYLLKTVTAPDLARAIREARAGLPTLAPEATKALIASVHNPGSGRNAELTEREREVLQLLVAGLSNPEIAQRLVVSRSTVKFHISSILEKLGASTRAEAAAIAVQRKLLEAKT